MKRASKPAFRIARIVSGVVIAIVGAVLVGWLAFAGYSWMGYGSAQLAPQPDAGLDHFIPVYEVAERNEIAVDAPWTNTYSAECLVDLRDSPLISAILRARATILRATPDPDAANEPTSFLAQAISLGWGVLAEDPGHEIIVGSVSQPWEANVAFFAVPPDRFASFATPGYAKIVWTLDAEPTGPSTSIARTVTRVETTDADSRSKFRNYWSTLAPGMLAIRQQGLQLIKDAAERDYRARGAAAPAATCAATQAAGGG